MDTGNKAPEKKTDDIAMTNLTAGDNNIVATTGADTLQKIISAVEIDTPSAKHPQIKKPITQASEKTKEVSLPAKEKVITVADSIVIPPQETSIESLPVEPVRSSLKRQVIVNSKLIVNLLLIDHPNMHERDKTDQPVKFSVVNDVVYDNVVIIQKGAVAKGTLTIGRVFTDIKLYGVTGTDGSFIPLKSERAHGRRADVETDKNYRAIVKQGTTITN